MPGRGQGVGQEIQCRDGSDEMAAGLAALSDQTVGARCDSAACLLGSTDHHEDEDPRIAQMPQQAALFAERQHGDVHTGIDTYLDMTSMYEGQQQVYRDGAARGLRAHPVDRAAQLAGRDQTERSEATRLGDRRRERRARQPTAHARLTHRNVEPEPVLDVHCLTPSFVCWRLTPSVILGQMDGSQRAHSACYTTGLLHNRKVTK